MKKGSLLAALFICITKTLRTRFFIAIVVSNRLSYLYIKNRYRI